MTKKKKLRQKHQADPGDVCNTSEDEEIQEKSAACPHIKKSLDIVAVRKVIKNRNQLVDCQSCSKSEVNESIENEENSQSEVEITIWLCLRCGNQGCGRLNGKHSLQHYNTPHSDSHALVVNTVTWAVWCYKCDEDVDVTSSKSLTDAIENIKKQSGNISKLKEPSPSSSSCFGKGQSQNEEKLEETVQANSPQGPSHISPVTDKKKRINGLVQTVPEFQVKGLQNLVNTCFFNAVMQNLSQIPCFLTALKNHCKEETSWKISIPSEIRDDYEEEFIECLLPPSKALTQELISLLEEMNSLSHDRKGVINPVALFRQVSEKCSRFRGGQQQDSHELLRFLLDGVRTEEVKRQKRAVLKLFKVNEMASPDQVDEDTKRKLKAFGKNVSHTIIEKIYGGQLVSTVYCEECKASSQVFEPFMDLSLPVSEEKRTRPGLQKRQSSEDTVDCFGRGFNSKGVTNSTASKHQDKKQKRQNKKEAKKQAKQARTISLNSSPVSENVPDSKTDEATCSPEDDGSEAEMNDADVEDNADDTTSLESVAAKTPDLETTDNQISPLSENSVECTPDLQNIETLSSAITSSITKDEMNYVTELVSELVISASQDSLAVQEDPTISEGITHENYLGSTDSGFCNSEKLEEQPPQQQTEDAADSKGLKSFKLQWLSKSWTSLAPKYVAASHECSVLSCLNLFTLPELLTGKNKFGCENCSKLKAESEGNYTDKFPMVYANATKQLLIFTPPAVLTLHLKRFQQNGRSLVKVNRFVEFPLVLDLAPFCSSIALGLPHMKNGQDKILYSLCGVVEHSGRLSGGHYTAYIRVKNQSQPDLSFLNESQIDQNEIDKLLYEFKKKSIETNQTYSLEEALTEGAASSNAGEMEAPLTQISGKWYHISDTHVTEASEASVLKCQAYLLFYERIF